MNSEIICIVCPKGCHIAVENKDGENKFSNYGCNRGIMYAQKELSEPRRMLTTTIKIDDAITKRLPVVSSEDIPKDMIMRCIEILSKVHVKAPIKVSDVIVKDILGLGVDIVATRTLNKVDEII